MITLTFARKSEKNLKRHIAELLISVFLKNCTVRLLFAHRQMGLL